MKFKRPYVYRIVGMLNGYAVELARWHRRQDPHDVEFIRDLSPGWVTWIERTLPDGNTITSRPGSKRWDKSGHKKPKGVAA